MQINALPHYDNSANTTGCCAKFNPEGWEGIKLHLRDKPFVRAHTRSFLHIPLNFGTVIARVNRNIEQAQAFDPDDFLVLSRDLSAWRAEHLFATGKSVPGEHLTTLSGDFVTRVFEGPFPDARKWHEELQQISRDHGKPDGRAFFFYTTCPKCAKVYGKNYVVGLAEV